MGKHYRKGVERDSGGRRGKSELDTREKLGDENFPKAVVKLEEFKARTLPRTPPGLLKALRKMVPVVPVFDTQRWQGEELKRLHQGEGSGLGSSGGPGLFDTARRALGIYTKHKA